MELEGSLPHTQQPATRSYSEPYQCSPYPPSYFLNMHFNIVLSSMPWSSKWSVSLRFPHQNPIRTSPLTHTRYMPCPSHSRFDHPNSIWWAFSSSTCSLLHSPVTSSLVGPNTLLSSLFSDTFSLGSSFNVTDQVSHPYKTTGKIVAVYIKIFAFFSDRKL